MRLKLAAVANQYTNTHQGGTTVIGIKWACGIIVILQRLVLMQTKQGAVERIVRAFSFARSPPSARGSFVAQTETMEGPIYKMHVVNWLLSGAKTGPLFCTL